MSAPRCSRFGDFNHIECCKRTDCWSYVAPEPSRSTSATRSSGSLAVHALVAADAYAVAYREQPDSEKTTAARSALLEILMEEERQRIALRQEVKGALCDHLMTVEAKG
jgi:hypothetical protein